MVDQEMPVDVYYDMEIAQICQHFSKSRNTVDKAVAKLVKDYPDAGYKYKNPETRRITIKAEGVEKLSKYFNVDFDVTGSIGKRYRRQDEIGTPFCICVDFDTAEDGQVTIRDRDTMEQVRLPIDEVRSYIEERLDF